MLHVTTGPHGGLRTFRGSKMISWGIQRKYCNMYFYLRRYRPVELCTLMGLSRISAIQYIAAIEHLKHEQND